MIILPRQARDKHRKNTQKEVRCSQADAATYNNVHPTDLGHWRIAEFYSQYLPPLLAGKAAPPAPVTASDVERLEAAALVAHKAAAEAAAENAGNAEMIPF